MPKYCYSPLAQGVNNIRLLRLMPGESTERTRLQCELFEYSLQDVHRRTHLYEALSYTWGGDEKAYSITIGEQELDVTANLYAALLRLRDCSLERIIWVDAICIDQKNLEEQGQQVQLMAMIYSKAHRVLVWLGETTDDVDGALEDIQRAANEESTEPSINEINGKAISKLLQREWFQRIWVLQEVAAARHVVVMCGSAEIDGYAFCLGLKSLRISPNFSDGDFPELQSLPSLTNLIERAGLRPKYRENLLERYSLDIRSLAELVDMFHARQASDSRDKVYALLGMSSDDPSKAGLLPDYKISWDELFQQLVKFILGQDMFVETHGQRALIKSKGYILGEVSSIRRDNRQNITIKYRNDALDSVKETEWVLHASVKSIQERDIVCCLHGASKPTIIRLCNDHFAVILIAATPLNESGRFDWLVASKSIAHFARDFLLIWDWERLPGQVQGQGEYKTLIKTYSQVPECLKAESGDHLGEVIRLWDEIMILDDLGEDPNVHERLLEARSVYAMAFRKEYLPRLDDSAGRTLLSFAAGEGHQDVIELLLRAFDPNIKDGYSGRTPLSYAAENGHKAVVQLLLATGQVDVDSKDTFGGRTPLSWAAQKGHEVVVQLLLATGHVDVDLKDTYSGQTSLSRAAENGHEVVVQLLLATGQVDVDSKDSYNRTPFSYAAENGYKAVTQLLLATGQVEVDSKDSNDRTPLSYAAQKGHEAVIQLLLKTGQVDVDLKDTYNGQTPLSYAVQYKYKAIVQLLLAIGQVDVNLKATNNDQRFLSFTAEKGHETVVQSLRE